MHSARLHIVAPSMRFRWPAVVVLGGLTGCLPFTVSGLPEFCAIVALPFCLGLLICRWWTDSLTRLALAIALPAFGSLVRLLSSSIHDGSNWFGRLIRAIGAVGFTEPYVRQILLTLLFPVLVTIVAAVMFICFQRRDHAKDA
jgi:hypothetical protein